MKSIFLTLVATIVFSTTVLAEDTCDSYDRPKYFEFELDEDGFAFPTWLKDENTFATLRDDNNGIITYIESENEYFNYRNPKKLISAWKLAKFEDMSGINIPYKHKVHAYGSIDLNNSNFSGYGFFNLGIDKAIEEGDKYGGRQSYRLFNGNLFDAKDGIHYNNQTGYMTGMIYGRELFEKEPNFRGVEYPYSSNNMYLDDGTFYLDAGIYIGPYKDELKHGGKGVMFYPADGFIFEDEFLNDVLVMNNVNSQEDFLDYYKGLRSDYSNNYKRLEYDDDSVYTHYIGEIINDVPYGNGILYHRNGYFAGQFEEGTLNGFGFEHITENEGEWMIIGQYENGSPTYGQLRQWDDNGLTQYWGEFKVNDLGERLRHGYGTLTYGDYDFTQQIIYSGEFKDHYHTVGTMIWPDGSNYYGEFLNGQRDGYGIFNQYDGLYSYDGYFKDGLEQGKGTSFKYMNNEYKLNKVESCFGKVISSVILD